MSDIPRRPPNDGIPEDLRQEEGYLLREGLPRETAERIGAVLDRAIRVRASRRRRWQLAASLAAATVAVAAIVGVFRNFREEQPMAVPAPPPPAVSEAPAPPAPPPPPPVAPLPERETSSESQPVVPARPPEAPPPPAPERPAERAAPRVPIASAPPPLPPPPVIDVAGGTVAGPREEPQVVRLYMRRTDDPSRDPIAMTIRYRAPSGSPKKENRP